MNLDQYVKNLQQITALRCPRGIHERRDKSGKLLAKIPLPWVLVLARESESSVDIALRVPIGYSAGDLEKEADAIYASFGAPVTLKDRGGVVVVSVAKNDFPDRIPYEPDMLTATSGRRVLCGYDQRGEAIIHDFRVPHVLIGATSGYGKTDLLRFWMLQLISRFTPDQLHIDIIDGKGFSFKPFLGVPHVRTIARDLPSAAMVLEDARLDMERRSDRVWASDEDRGEATGGFRWRLVIIDEMYIIAPYSQVTKEKRKIATAAYSNMAAISCVGREAGVGCIMATQRPDVNVVHPQVKQNCDVSIAMHVKTQTNSEIILDRSGAELLPRIPGRAIYSGKNDVVFQIPFVGDDKAWDIVLKPYKTEWKEDEHHEPKQEGPDLDDVH